MHAITVQTGQCAHTYAHTIRVETIWNHYPVALFKDSKIDGDLILYTQSIQSVSNLYKYVFSWIQLLKKQYDLLLITLNACMTAFLF